jgi:hypothetical protein
MLRATLCILLFLLAAALPCCAQQKSVADSLFSVAQAAYDDGNYDAAELAALRGLREAAGQDDLGRLRFHAMLGFIDVARDQKDAALREFKTALSANPAYAPDPVSTSPKILEVFKQARTDYLLLVASEPAVYRMPQADVRLAASWRSLVLPGWGQFYKQQDVKGSAIMAAQVVSLAALILMQVQVNHSHNDYLAIKDYTNPVIEDRYNVYRQAYRSRNAVGYVTLGIYLFNYLDALYTPVWHKKK